jgi:molybdate transport repressor ModE-like protein
VRFDLNDLQLLIHIVETGSITAGARRCQLSLASASARVHGMETTLGVPIFERGRRGVQPTPAGLSAVHHARLVLQQIDRMHGELGEHAQGLRGQLKLLSNTAALTEYLPEVLSAFLTSHPTVDLDIEERPSQDITRALMQARADIGVVAHWADTAGLETFPFRIDRLVIVAPAQHPIVTRGRSGGVPFAESFGYDFVGLADGSALQEHLAAQAERAGKKLKYRVRLRSFDAVCRMVEQNVGISVMPQVAVERCSKSMKIKCVQLTDPWASRQLRLCVRRFDDLSQHGKRLISMLRA